LRKSKYLLALILLSLSVLLGACKFQNKASNTIYTTIYPVYSLTKLIAKDKLVVEKIVKDGAEIHSFEPSSKDIAKLTSSKAVIYLGLVDEWIKKPLEGTNVKVFKASTGIDFLQNDPHIWTSPKLLKKMAKNIEEALIKIDPKNRQYYERNYISVLSKLDELDRQFQDVASRAKRKEFLISHPSFGYLAKDYGLWQYSITGVNEEEEPSAAKMKEIVDLVKKKNIKYILVDPNENLPGVKSLAKDTGIKIVYAYGMGIVSKEQSQKDTILSLMEKNLKAFEVVLSK